MKQHVRSVTWVVAIATFMAIAMAAQGNLRAIQNNEEVYWLEPFLSFLVFWYLWALLYAPVGWLVRRFPPGSGIRISGVVAHISACLVVCFVHMVTNVSLFRIFFDGPDTTRPFWSVVFGVPIPFRIIIYGALVGSASTIEYYRKFRERDLRTSQLEAQLARAELQALRMQLHPHFLFNTLNGIMVLIQENPDAAARTVARLSEFLRLTLENAGTQEVALVKEMEFLRKYLEIEQMRFGDRLTVRENIDYHVLDAPVPSMILQPLVENSIRHGVATCRGPALIEISAGRENGTLLIQVRDNGRGLPEDMETSGTIKEGIGLSNTRARLLQLYGNRHTLDLVNVPEGGLEVRVSLPFRDTWNVLPETLEDI
jgi:signal transduction histidine kinase